jgi:hypothetical protein
LLAKYKSLLLDKKFDWGRKSNTDSNSAIISNIVTIIQAKFPPLAKLDAFSIKADLTDYITAIKSNQSKLQAAAAVASKKPTAAATTSHQKRRRSSGSFASANSPVTIPMLETKMKKIKLVVKELLQKHKELEEQKKKLEAEQSLEDDDPLARAQNLLDDSYDNDQDRFEVDNEPALSSYDDFDHLSDI